MLNSHQKLLNQAIAGTYHIMGVYHPNKPRKISVVFDLEQSIIICYELTDLLARLYLTNKILGVLQLNLFK